MMKYYCHNCGNKFDKPMIKTEVSNILDIVGGFGIGIRKTGACPQCGSEDFQEIMRSDDQ